MEQISDAPAQIIEHSGLGYLPLKHREVLAAEISQALTAARMEGERQGLERAMKAVKMFWPDTEIIATIEALAKEPPHE